ncbi:MAG TPA: hypothetical protein VFP74_09465 [Pseudolabrys sp.]|nr:hypothetical protein [Pseudolabrys sp.]
MSARILTAGAIAALLALPIAAPASASDSLSLSARAHRHHHAHRHHGDSRAALRMFGMVAGTIAGIAAEQERRDGYGYPPPGYYGYGPYYPY